MSQDVVLVLFQVVALVMAFSVHECAHAWVAWKLGDPTAMMLGRVTLNPLKHLDPFGSVLIPLIGLVYGGMLVGWAKPTPVNGRNFKHYKRDDMMVTLAGPASNILLASVALLLLIVLKHTIAGGYTAVVTAMALASHYRGVSTANLPTLFPLALLLYFIILINLLLFVFNLIPVPPLDGSRILRQFLPFKVAEMYDRMGMLGMIVVMLIGGSFIFRIFLTPLRAAFDTLLFTL